MAAAINAGPFLANGATNTVLNSLAADPGPLPAGAVVTPIYAALKRKRCEVVQTLDASPAEKKAATDMLNELEHRSMGLAEGNGIYHALDDSIKINYSEINYSMHNA